MEERVYDLLEKLYIELQGVQADIKDIRGTMATKDDLKNFATKDDLKNFATKDDIKYLASKEDITLLAGELHTEIQAVYDKVRELGKDFNTMEILTTKNAYDIAKFKLVRER